MMGEQDLKEAIEQNLIIYIVIGLIILALIIAIITSNKKIKKENIDMIKIKVNNNVLEVKLEDNEATKILV